MPSRNIRVVLIAALTALLLACGGSHDSSETNAESDGTVYWEPGEWGFDAKLDPWPAAAGTPVTLRAVAGIDDYDQSFSGTVSYRLSTPSNTEAWTRMRLVGDEDGDMVYEATVSLPDERVGIHFLVSRSTDGTTHELTDWSVVPK